jgi:hypothetical protein
LLRLATMRGRHPVRRRHRPTDQRIAGPHVPMPGTEFRQRLGARPDPVNLRLCLRLNRSLLSGRLLNGRLLNGNLLNRRRLNRSRLLHRGPFRLLPDPLGLGLVPSLLDRRRHLR